MEDSATVVITLLSVLAGSVEREVLTLSPIVATLVGKIVLSVGCAFLEDTSGGVDNCRVPSVVIPVGTM